MRVAGRRAFDHLSKKLAPLELQHPHVLIVCGGGNNGGDGYVVGSQALDAGWNVTLVALKPPKSEESKKVCSDFGEAGGVIETQLSDVHNYDAVVDAVFGIGLSRY